MWRGVSGTGNSYMKLVSFSYPGRRVFQRKNIVTYHTHFRANLKRTLLCSDCQNAFWDPFLGNKGIQLALGLHIYWFSHIENNTRTFCISIGIYTRHTQRFVSYIIAKERAHELEHFIERVHVNRRRTALKSVFRIVMMPADHVINDDLRTKASSWLAVASLGNAS